MPLFILLLHFKNVLMFEKYYNFSFNWLVILFRVQLLVIRTSIKITNYIFFNVNIVELTYKNKSLAALKRTSAFRDLSPATNCNILEEDIFFVF